MASRKLLHVVDGQSYIYRAYHTIRSLTTSSGEPTNAVYGFTQMLQKLLETERPEYLALTFDAGGKNFRNELFPEYKAHRKPPPDDLPGQIDRIYEVVRTFRIATFAIQGFEADDLIATLTRFGLEHDCDVKLITSDKDLMQLVSDRVSGWDPMFEQRYRPKNVEEKHGVPPSKMGALLALMGDASDNIPGVRGVGAKTAAKLIAEHGDLAGILAAAKAGKIKGKLCQKIVDSEDAMWLSAKLVALKDDVPLHIVMDDLRYPGPDLDAQRALFTELELKRLISKAESGPAPTKAREAPATGLDHSRYEIVTTQAGLTTLAKRLAKASVIGLSVEHPNTRFVDTPIDGIAVSDAPGQAAYIPVGDLSVAQIIDALRAVLADDTVKKSCTNCKAWYALARRYDFELRGVAFDTSIACYLIDPDDRYDQSSAIMHGADDGPHGAGDVARKFLSAKTIARSSVVGRGRDRVPFNEVALDRAGPFVAERADIAIRAQDRLQRELERSELVNVYRDIELPLVPILADMERAGLRIDVTMLADMKRAFAKEIGRLEALCHELAGHEFKVNSPAQLRTVLFEEKGLKIIKRTKTGPSTDQSVLEELATMDDLPKAIIEYRQVMKLQSTYVVALPQLIVPETGRIHTSLSQIVAATGRLSASEPNVQNIPIRTELGRGLRKAFIAKDGHRLISVDYSQIELRVLAHFSEEPVLVSAFEDREDVHRRTASLLFDVPPADVTYEQRTQAKTVNFGVLYGMGPVRLARDLGIPRRTASKFIDDYFARQPKVKALLEGTKAYAREHGYVRTLMGRRRWVRDIESKNRVSRSGAERIATNTPIQGSAADLIKLAMIRVAGRLADELPEAQLLLQVHDELLVEAPDAVADDAAALIRHEMEQAYPLKVPLVAEAHVGLNWDEAH